MWTFAIKSLKKGTEKKKKRLGSAGLNKETLKKIAPNKHVANSKVSICVLHLK